MKKSILLTLVLFSALILSSCSYSYDFFIVNNSDSILEIEYKWKEDLHSTPEKFGFKNFDGESFEKLWIVADVTKEEIESAEEANTFYISLKPKQALRIHSILGGDRDKIKNKVEGNFKINFLKLKGKNGLLELTDKQVWFQFYETKKDYFINYK